MSGLQSLLMLAGTWAGKNRLQLSPTTVPDVSDSTLTVTPVLKDRFVRLDYTWRFGHAPQEGCFILGFDSGTKEASAFWIDSFHMGEKGMDLRGTVDGEGQIHLVGSYKAPPGPDWGWRTVIIPNSDNLRLVSYNISPNGEEDLAVEGDFTKAQ